MLLPPSVLEVLIYIFPKNLYLGVELATGELRTKSGKPGVGQLCNLLHACTYLAQVKHWIHSQSQIPLHVSGWSD